MSKVMKLVDGYTGKMECKVCGAVHFAATEHGGGYKRGSWQCQFKCELPKPQKPGYNGFAAVVVEAAV